jgi:hypothetical protein
MMVVALQTLRVGGDKGYLRHNALVVDVFRVTAVIAGDSRCGG